MLSVHGIQVNGGTFPAADLARLHDGRQRQRLRRLPVVGYGTSGTPTRRGSRRPHAGKKARATAGAEGKGQGRAPGKNGKTSGYDPSLYESPPQPAPNTGKPSPPSPGSGNGGTGAPGCTAGAVAAASGSGPRQRAARRVSMCKAVPGSTTSRIGNSQ